MTCKVFITPILIAGLPHANTDRPLIILKLHTAALLLMLLTSHTAYSQQGTPSQGYHPVQKDSVLSTLRELQALSAAASTYRQEKPSEAIFYLKHAIALAMQKKLYNQEIRYLDMITPLYKLQGRFREALLSQEREHLLVDSLYHKAVAKNMASLMAENDLQRSAFRIKELALLNNQRRLERERSILLSRITLAGTLVLLMLAGLLYYQFRQHQRTNIRVRDRNGSLQRLLAEKEWLLKEVHHRVKNNLQIVISLLNTQSKYLDSKEALNAIRESKHRMEAMSLIHQKLYNAGNTTAVHMRYYISELAEYLTASFNAGKQVKFDLQVEAIELDIAQAIPVALILNEAITNAIKYAFPDRESGIIIISMQYVENSNIMLKVKDNGIGFPENFDAGSVSSMGIRLMKGLVMQLNGKLTISNEPGTCIKVCFKADTILKPLPVHGGSKISDVSSQGIIT